MFFGPLFFRYFSHISHTHTPSHRSKSKPCISAKTESTPLPYTTTVYVMRFCCGSFVVAALTHTSPFFGFFSFGLSLSVVLSLFFSFSRSISKVSLFLSLSLSLSLALSASHRTSRFSSHPISSHFMHPITTTPAPPPLPITLPRSCFVLSHTIPSHAIPRQAVTPYVIRHTPYTRDSSAVALSLLARSLFRFRHFCLTSHVSRHDRLTLQSC